MAEREAFDPWSKVVNKLIDQITKIMNPEKVAMLAVKVDLLTDADARKIRRMYAAGIQSDLAVNSEMIDLMRGSGIDGYICFKKILDQVGDQSHKNLLRTINEWEIKNLSEPQLQSLLQGESTDSIDGDSVDLPSVPASGPGDNNSARQAVKELKS